MPHTYHFECNPTCNKNDWKPSFVFLGEVPNQILQPRPNWIESATCEFITLHGLGIWPSQQIPFISQNWNEVIPNRRIFRVPNHHLPWVSVGAFGWNKSIFHPLPPQKYYSKFKRCFHFPFDTLSHSERYSTRHWYIYIYIYVNIYLYTIYVNKYVQIKKYIYSNNYMYICIYKIYVYAYMHMYIKGICICICKYIYNMFFSGFQASHGVQQLATVLPATGSTNAGAKGHIRISLEGDVLYRRIPLFQRTGCVWPTHLNKKHGHESLVVRFFFDTACQWFESSEGL